jgi:thioredoxin reductase (NADPH)
MEFKLFQNQAEDKIYDLIVIGAGPAGYSCAIYAKRFNLDVLVIGKTLGGVAGEAYEVENYPGFRKIKGKELMNQFENHAKDLGAIIIQDEIRDLEKTNENNFLVKTMLGNTYQSKTIVFATGTRRRKLNIPGEDEFYGKGVSYCATCDAMFFKDKIVAVIGGGDSAISSSLMLAKWAKKIYLINNLSEFTSAPQWFEKVKSNDKIEILCDSKVEKIVGKDKVEKIKIIKNNKSEELNIDGIFIEIGGIPTTALAKKLKIKTDEKGLIIVDSSQRTNIPYTYGAGDCTNASNKVFQIVVAASEGTIATDSLFRDLQKVKKENNNKTKLCKL